MHENREIKVMSYQNISQHVISDKLSTPVTDNGIASCWFR